MRRECHPVVLADMEDWEDCVTLRFYPHLFSSLLSSQYTQVLGTDFQPINTELERMGFQCQLKRKIPKLFWVQKTRELSILANLTLLWHVQIFKVQCLAHSFIFSNYKKILNCGYKALHSHNMNALSRNGLGSWEVLLPKIQCGRNQE